MKLIRNLALLIVTLMIFFISPTYFGVKKVFGYGYGYGYDVTPKIPIDNNDKVPTINTKITISTKKLFDNKTSKHIIKLDFKNLDNIVSIKVSKSKKFKGVNWESKKDSREISIDPTKKQYIYVRLRDENGNESTERVLYNVPNRFIANSKQKVAKGDILLQKGFRFSKDSTVMLYFSKTDGSYYKPVIARTDPRGSFIIQYKVKKATGKYTWYAMDPKTGRKSHVTSYTVK